MIQVLPSLKNRLVSGAIWAFIGRIVMALGGLGVSVLITRLLSQKDAGLYFLAFSLVTVIAIVGQMGMQVLVVKTASAALVEKNDHELKKLVLSLNLVGVVTCGIAGLILGFTMEPIFVDAFGVAIPPGVPIIVALWAGMRGLQNLIGETFRGLHEVRLASFFGGALENIFLSVCLLVTWLLGSDLGLEKAACLAAVSTGLGLLIALFLLQKRLKFKSLKVGFPALKLLRPAFPMMVTSVMILGLNQADIWVLGVLMDERDVAIYGAAKRLIVTMAIPLTIVNAVIAPIISELNVGGDKVRLESILRRTASLSSIPVIILLIFFISGAGQILAAIFGDNYAAGSTVLVFLSAGYAVNVWTGSCGKVLQMTGHQFGNMVVTVLFGLIAVLGSVLAVGSYGLEGVAAVVGASMAMQNIIMLFLVRRMYGIWTHVGHLRDSLRSLLGLVRKVKPI